MGTCLFNLPWQQHNCATLLSSLCLQVTSKMDMWMCASELEALPRTHHCGTFPLTGTSGSGSIGTCCGSFFGFCSDVHTCHTPASDGWSGEKNPGGLRGGVKKKNIRNVISAHMKQTCFHLTRLLRHKVKYSLRKFIKI